uniref:Uncharacterized protein n=1 Tax=Pandoraea thiooxydans TaxID=445709 RepID=A0A0U4ELF1_9BURK
MRWLTSALAVTCATVEQRSTMPTAASSGQKYCHLAARLGPPSLKSSDSVESDEGGCGVVFFRVVWG